LILVWAGVVRLGLRWHPRFRVSTSCVAPVRGSTYFSLPPQRKVGKRKRANTTTFLFACGTPTGPTPRTASHLLTPVASVPDQRITHFTLPRPILRDQPAQVLQVANCVSAVAPYTHHSGLKSKDGVSCRSADAYGAPTYTQFATWAAVTIRCRWRRYG
jgi:hypothetical protein